MKSKPISEATVRNLALSCKEGVNWMDACVDSRKRTYWRLDGTYSAADLRKLADWLDNENKGSHD